MLHVIGWIALIIGALVLIVGIVFIGVIFGRPSEKSGFQPNFAGADEKQKRLVVFLDGTWNSVDSNTNVWRMRALCASRGKDGKTQLVYYGIGVNGALGGIFGEGLDENIRLAYEWLIENYNAGDEIFIFGFSRGAYTARSLAGLIAIVGLLKAGSPIGVAELFDRYKKKSASIFALGDIVRAGDGAQLTQQEQWLLKYTQFAEVTMVGVWDTVGSVGWKTGNIRGVSRSTFSYLQTGLRQPIKNAYHALAIDEHRADFAPTLWDVHHPNDPAAHLAPERPLSSVEQRWFVGAHANVGGGYPTDLLAQVPLRWMMSKAETHGLSFRWPVELDGKASSASIADSYGDFAHGIYKHVSRPYHRVIGRDPEIRSDGSHINVNETIDRSVFERWRADPAYRPENVLEWAKRKSVDPLQLHSSVRADNPAIEVMDPASEAI